MKKSNRRQFLKSAAKSAGVKILILIFKKVQIEKIVIYQWNIRFTVIFS
jgi:hypothetical protein